MRTGNLRALRGPAAGLWTRCFSAYMSMQCSSIFPRCSTPQSTDEPAPAGGRVPMCLHLCIVPLVACPGFWISDIAGPCSVVSVPPLCSQAFYWNSAMAQGCSQGADPRARRPSCVCHLSTARMTKRTHSQASARFQIGPHQAWTPRMTLLCTTTRCRLQAQFWPLHPRGSPQLEVGLERGACCSRLPRYPLRRGGRAASRSEASSWPSIFGAQQDRRPAPAPPSRISFRA